MEYLIVMGFGTVVITTAVITIAVILALRRALSSIISRLFGEVGSVYWLRFVCLTISLYAVSAGMRIRDIPLRHEGSLLERRSEILMYLIYSVTEQTLTALAQASIALFVVVVFLFIIIKVLELIRELVRRDVAT